VEDFGKTCRLFKSWCSGLATGTFFICEHANTPAFQSTVAVWQSAGGGGPLPWADTGMARAQHRCDLRQGTVQGESPAWSLVCQRIPAVCVSWEAKDELSQVHLLDVANRSFLWGRCHLTTDAACCLLGVS